MKSLFEEDAYREILSRLEQLNASDQSKWGRMTVGQMVWHCQVPLRVAVENKPVKARANPILLWLFKKSLYNDRPWRKGLPTSPIARAVEPKDFDSEYPKLIGLVKECYEVRGRQKWNEHPLFGKLTPEQWGKMQYKHLDHHLRQFGH